MAAYVVPLISDRIPMVRNPMLVSPFEYPRARYPMEKAPIPLPITRSPSIAITVRWLVFDTRRGGRRIAQDVARQNKLGGEQRGGNNQCRPGGILHRLHDRYLNI